MEYISGDPLKNNIDISYAEKLGKNIGILHENNIIHGDLTTSNILVTTNDYKSELCFIDFGLSYISSSIEAKGVDIHVLFQTLESTHSKICEKFIYYFVQSYKKYCKSAEKILKRVKEIKKRGRYM